MEGKAQEKKLGLFHAVSIIGGIMIGSGVFYCGAFVMERSGLSSGFALMAWVIAGLMSVMAGLCYAELGTAFKKGGGTYTYISEAYGPGIGFSMGWTDFFISQPGSISALAMGFATYFAAIVPMGNFQIKALAIGVIVLLTAVNILGLKTGGNLQNVLMVAKLVPIVLIIVLGLALGKADNPMTMIPGEGKSFLGAFAMSIVAALWAFDGWSTVYFVSDKLKNPKKNLPLAIILGVLGVTLIYFLFNFALIRVMPAADIAADGAPAATAATIMLGKNGALLVTIGALISILGSCNGCLMTVPHEFKTMADDKRFFNFLGYVHPKLGTPINSQLSLAAIAIILILWGTFEQLTALVVFSAWIYYTLGVSSVIRMRKKKPDMERPYKVFLYPILPIVTMILAIVVLFTNLYEDVSGSFLGLLIPISGWVVYHLYFKKKERKAVHAGGVEPGTGAAPEPGPAEDPDPEE